MPQEIRVYGVAGAAEVKYWLMAVGGISGFFFLLFSAVHQPAKLSLPLWDPCVVGMVGCLCTLHCGDACHEHV